MVECNTSRGIPVLTMCICLFSRSLGAVDVGGEEWYLYRKRERMSASKGGLQKDIQHREPRGRFCYGYSQSSIEKSTMKSAFSFNDLEFYLLKLPVKDLSNALSYTHHSHRATKYSSSSPSSKNFICFQHARVINLIPKGYRYQFMDL